MNINYNHGTKDVGDCEGCGHLLQELMINLTSQMNDEEFLRKRANSFCGWCKRKPEEVRRYNSANTARQDTYDSETDELIGEKRVPLEDRWTSSGQSMLQSAIAGALAQNSINPKYYNQDGINRLNEFVRNSAYEGESGFRKFVRRIIH